uniref:Uncharacterized protein n=1 Tax=Anguilla anguilla TaxID=7936 RepID=A0A0E9WWQ5_ANGAN
MVTTERLQSAQTSASIPFLFFLYNTLLRYTVNITKRPGTSLYGYVSHAAFSTVGSTPEHRCSSNSSHLHH